MTPDAPRTEAGKRLLAALGGTADTDYTSPTANMILAIESEAARSDPTVVYPGPHSGCIYGEAATPADSLDALRAALERARGEVRAAYEQAQTGTEAEAFQHGRFVAYAHAIEEADRLRTGQRSPRNDEPVPAEGDADFDATAIDYRRGSPQTNPAADSLDAAWAEAGLPDGWIGPFVGPDNGKTGKGDWWAEAQWVPVSIPQRAVTEYGPTPAAALRALADRLRAEGSSKPPEPQP